MNSSSCVEILVDLAFPFQELSYSGKAGHLLFGHSVKCASSEIGGGSVGGDPVQRVAVSEVSLYFGGKRALAVRGHDPFLGLMGALTDLGLLRISYG